MRAKKRPNITASGTFALLGLPNVGKSTLLNALVGEPLAIVSNKPQTTRDALLGIRTEAGAQFLFLDTPGVHMPKNRLGRWMDRAREEAIGRADAYVVVMDATRITEEDLAVRATLPSKKPVVLALNKIDRLRDKASLLPLLQQLGDTFAVIVPLSATKEDGLSRLLDELRPHLRKGPSGYTEDDLSDRPMRYFAAEYVRGELLRETEQEVPHGIATVIERFVEDEDGIHVDVSIFVERESHKKIVIGKGGEVLKRVGTRARKKLGALLGGRVHMKLWVRAASDWRDDPKHLRTFGYA